MQKVQVWGVGERETVQSILKITHTMGTPINPEGDIYQCALAVFNPTQASIQHKEKQPNSHKNLLK